MKADAQGRFGWRTIRLSSVGLLLVAGALGACILAPTEATMGDLQRILYIHVPSAWLALAGMLVAALSGAAYLARRDLAWDHAAQAAAELGWLCAGLALLTGALWAHAAWGVWWTWDPRLTATFVLWLLYCGLLTLRSQVSDRQYRARLCAVVAIVGALDIPLVLMATRWFRGVHPVVTEMAPAMRLVLWLNVGAGSALFVLAFDWRRRRLQTARRRESMAYVQEESCDCA
jgi:heme exporter protein C